MWLLRVLTTHPNHSRSADSYPSRVYVPRFDLIPYYMVILAPVKYFIFGVYIMQNIMLVGGMAAGGNLKNEGAWYLKDGTY